MKDECEEEGGNVINGKPRVGAHGPEPPPPPPHPPKTALTGMKAE